VLSQDLGPASLGDPNELFLPAQQGQSADSDRLRETAPAG